MPEALELLLGGSMWPALCSAVAIGLVCSLLGVLVVLKRMTFVGHGISHAGFGGAGTAALLGLGTSAMRWQQDAVIFLFCLVSAVLIGVLARRRRVETDTAIGILLAASMAWGVLAQNLRVAWQTQWPAYQEWIGEAGYVPPWEQLMFGSLLSIRAIDAWLAVAMAVLVLGLCGLLLHELIYFAFDEAAAQVHGVRTGFLHYLVLVMLCVVVVVSIRLTGLILVSALLVIPAATALRLSSRLNTVLMSSAVIGVLSCAGGLLLSLSAGDLSPGGCIVAILCAFFLAASVWTGLKKPAAGSI